MKKIQIAMVMVVFMGLGSWAESLKERHYVNLSFTVWQLKNEPSEAARRIKTAIPEVFRESWICEILAFDVTDGKPATKELKKDGFRFILTAESNARLTIQVYEKDNECFRFIHYMPSTVNAIFYGPDNRTYLIEASHTVDNHPVGLVSPGILKK